MKLGIYVIRDKKTTFMQPTFDMNDQSAMRNFENACRATTGIFNTHAADFDLYCIGEYDMLTGRIDACEPRFVCGGFASE